jgi:protein TonB
VVLRVEVLSDGNPDRIEVRKSSGYAILDEAAYEAVKEWKFKPAMRGDKPIDSWVEIPIRFTLRDG